ncbi:MAG TPA: RNA polymerase sigma-G factor [Lachnospiraceae bacterium]|nr:RNA polymerase sigma-G factor [Lachnospiraceae bacterium]
MEEVAVLIARSQAGDKAAREVLIEKNLGLVHHIVKRFLGRGYDAEDLFQIGSIGLMKAIDKFDLTYDVKFSTYAVPMISGEIKRFLRDDGMVKVSRTLKENGWKVRQASEQIAHEKGRDATLEEISEVTGIMKEDIVMALEANVEVESIYKSVYQSDGNEIYLVDKLPEKKDENEKLLNHMLLEQLLGELAEEERMLIRLRYFQNKTQVEVAKNLGISQVQVSRMEKKILVRMREKLL